MIKVKEILIIRKFPQSPEILSEWRVISKNQELHLKKLQSDVCRKCS